jgi:hypothetical protein
MGKSDQTSSWLTPTLGAQFCGAAFLLGFFFFGLLVVLFSTSPRGFEGLTIIAGLMWVYSHLMLTAWGYLKWPSLKESLYGVRHWKELGAWRKIRTAIAAGLVGAYAVGLLTWITLLILGTVFIRDQS